MPVQPGGRSLPSSVICITTRKETLMTRLPSLTLITLSVFALPLDAQARQNTGYTGTGIIIKGPIDCEHKKIRKCHWEGTKLVCVWVELPDCEIF
jgi:hypothetical protein